MIGLAPYRLPGPWDPDPVVRALERGLARFAEEGVGAETRLVGLDGGLHKDEGRLELFEQVVGPVLRHAPGAAVAFTTGPADASDAASRWNG